MNIQKELTIRIGELLNKDYNKQTSLQSYKLYCDEHDFNKDITCKKCNDCHFHNERIISEEAMLNTYIGQEPSLPDLLMAIDKIIKFKTSMSISLQTDGLITIIDYNESDGVDEAKYIQIDLSKSLFNQSKETLQAIYNLLK